MTARECLIYLALKFNGDYRMMRDAIQRRELPDDEETIPPMKCKVVTMLDDDYPSYLLKGYMPPIVLFYYGDLSLMDDPARNLSVIGTRKPNNYGIKATRTLVGWACEKNINIVSGLAKGIDAIAHWTAIENGCKTIAVLGSGIDYCYPSVNFELYEKIKKDHLVISEYPGFTIPQPSNFPFRNRLIASLTNCVLITDALYKSGTSITAGFALEYGKDVCTIPHPIYQESLCNRLIEEGATMILSKDDLYKALKIEESEPIFEN